VDTSLFLNDNNPSSPPHYLITTCAPRRKVRLIFPLLLALSPFFCKIKVLFLPLPPFIWYDLFFLSKIDYQIAGKIVFFSPLFPSPIYGGQLLSSSLFNQLSDCLLLYEDGYSVLFFFLLMKFMNVSPPSLQLKSLPFLSLRSFFSPLIEGEGHSFVTVYPFSPKAGIQFFFSATYWPFSPFDVGFAEALPPFFAAEKLLLLLPSLR